MTLEEFVTTLTLAERIVWLRSADGPEGAISHDVFAERLVNLGAPPRTSRQTIINWEKKEKGNEPRDSMAALAAFSGMPAAAFSRRGAEVLVKASSVPRLQLLETHAEMTLVILQLVLGALKEHGIQVQLPQEAVEFLANAGPSGRPN